MAEETLIQKIRRLPPERVAEVERCRPGPMSAHRSNRLERAWLPGFPVQARRERPHNRDQSRCLLFWGKRPGPPGVLTALPDDELRGANEPSRFTARHESTRATHHRYAWSGTAARRAGAAWLSCHRFRANEVRLQLSVLAHNLGNLWRRLVLPKRIDTWSLTSLQQRLVKTGGLLIKHARYYWLLLAESHLTRRLFGAMLRRIWALPVPTG